MIRRKAERGSCSRATPPAPRPYCCECGIVAVGGRREAMAAGWEPWNAAADDGPMVCAECVIDYYTPRGEDHRPHIRGNVLRIRPEHWWWELIDTTPGREAIVNVGPAPTQSEAFRLCCLMLRIHIATPSQSDRSPFQSGKAGLSTMATEGSL